MKHIYLLNEFKNPGKNEMFNQLKDLVLKEENFKDKRVLMLGNYKQKPFDYDAIIIVDNYVFIIEFKLDICSQINVTEAFESWHDEHGIELWAGRNNCSPYGQSLNKRNYLYGCLKNRIKQQLFLRSIVLYRFDVEVMCNGDFDIHNHKWFFINSFSNIINTIEQHSSLVTFIDYYKAFFKATRSAVSLTDGMNEYKMGPTGNLEIVPKDEISTRHLEGHFDERFEIYLKKPNPAAEQAPVAVLEQKPEPKSIMKTLLDFLSLCVNTLPGSIPTVLPDRSSCSSGHRRC